MRSIEDVLSFKSSNPYRDDAHLALANMAMADKHPNEAFKEYEALSREATKPALQAESALKAGLLARDLEQNDTAYALAQARHRIARGDRRRALRTR